MRLLRLTFPLALTFAIGACATEPHTDVLSVSAVGDGLRLDNRSSDYVTYIVLEREFAASAEFVLCDHVLDPVATCGFGIAALGSAHDANAQIGGYHAGAEVIVYHARLIRDPATGYFVQDRLRNLVVKTP